MIAELAVSLAVLLAALAACSTAGSAPSPSGSALAPGPPLSGRLTVATNDGGVGQLTATATGRTSYDQIVPGGKPSGNPTPAALSPDGSTLAYGTSRGITLHDVRSGGNRTLVAPDSGNFNFSVTCVNWSPNGQLLAVGTSDGLYATNLSGHTTSLASVTQQEYTPQPGSGGNIDNVSSTATCGYWLDNTTLVFNQSGTFPASIPANFGSTLPANTTTVATFSGMNVKLANSASQWSIVATCGNNAITEDSSSLFLVSGLAGDANLASGQATPADARLPGTVRTSDGLFIPGSCQPVIIQADQQPSVSVLEISPQTRRTVKTLQFPDNENDGLPSSGSGADFTWDPQSAAPVLAYVGSSGGLYLVNLVTGGVTSPNNPPWNDAAQILAWSR